MDIATFVHNTSNHTFIGCSPTLLFHGRQPLNPIDLRFNNTHVEKPTPTLDFIIYTHYKMETIFVNAHEKNLQAYHKYREVFDRKARALPLKLHSYCLLLNPKLISQNDSLTKSNTKWLPLYRVESDHTWKLYYSQSKYQ